MSTNKSHSVSIEKRPITITELIFCNYDLDNETTREIEDLFDWLTDNNLNYGDTLRLELSWYSDSYLDDYPDAEYIPATLYCNVLSEGCTAESVRVLRRNLRSHTITVDDLFENPFYQEKVKDKDERALIPLISFSVER